MEFLRCFCAGDVDGLAILSVTATMEEQERLVLDLASGSADRDRLLTWIKANCGSRGTPES